VVVDEVREAVPDGGEDRFIQFIGVGSQQLDMTQGGVAVDFARQHGDMGAQNIIHLEGVALPGRIVGGEAVVETGGGVVWGHAVFLQ